LAPTISRLIGKVKKLAAPRPNLVNGFQADIDVVRAEPLILVVAPTRELACQIFDEARRLCYRTMLRPCVVYGGGPVREQRDELQKGCDILVATPGRLKDFMDKPHILSLNRVRFVPFSSLHIDYSLTSHSFTIIDEADELLHDDWRDDLEKIMSGGGMFLVLTLPRYSHAKCFKTPMKMPTIAT
jgi:ATP-dependent RNA helicase DDX3X